MRNLAILFGGAAMGALLIAMLRGDQTSALAGIGFAILAHLSLQLHK